jgi:hypothetical protein
MDDNDLYLANIASGQKPFDLGAVAGHSTGDASRRPHSRCDPIRPGDASRPAARDSCSAPPIGRARSVEWALFAHLIASYG